MNWQRDLLIGACTFSAGVHAALAPEHLDEAPVIGAGFMIAAPLLAITALALIRWPSSRWPLWAAVALFTGMIGAYVVTRTMVVHGLYDEKESLDVVSVATKTVEVIGVVLALALDRALRPRGLRSAAHSGGPA